MNTIERIHAYYHSAPTLSDNNNVYLQNLQHLMEEPIVVNDNYINTHYYIQNQLNDEIKNNSISLFSSYWNNLFESMKLVNRYWMRIFNIGNSNSFIV